MSFYFIIESAKCLLMPKSTPLLQIDDGKNTMGGTGLCGWLSTAGLSSRQAGEQRRQMMEGLLETRTCLIVISAAKDILADSIYVVDIQQQAHAVFYDNSSCQQRLLLQRLAASLLGSFLQQTNPTSKSQPDFLSNASQTLGQSSCKLLQRVCFVLKK